MSNPLYEAKWQFRTTPVLEWVPSETVPTVRYVKDDKVIDFINGDLTTDSFLDKTGLRFSLENGAFDFSKRFSRVIRPYQIAALLPAKSVRVVYSNKWDKKTWDGAGWISRKLLRRLNVYASDPITQKRIRHDIDNCTRVEGTHMGHLGQDKGHWRVTEHFDYDLMLPCDSKAAVRMESDQVFIGINVIRAHQHMELDIQSHVNLHPFFSHDQIAQWLEESGACVLRDIENGKIENVLSRIETPAKWALREFFQRGGQMNWFGSVIRKIGMQHVHKVSTRSVNNLRFPIPGGRYYVFTDEVVCREIPEGHVQLDTKNASIIVSSHDWPQLSDVWGGADQDDMIWTFPFTDTADNERKILCWRSPNEVGQYAVLRPTQDSDTIWWDTGVDKTAWPKMDNDLLPLGTKDHLNLVPVETNRNDEHYSLQAMDAAIKNAQENIFTLGFVCNLQIAYKAQTGQPIPEMPAPLEKIVDATVKTGASLKEVKAWCYRFALEFVKSTNNVIFEPLADRIAGMLPDWEYITTTDSNWLSDLIEMAENHNKSFISKLNAFADKAVPPEEILIIGASHVKDGEMLNDVYKDLLASTNSEAEGFWDTIEKKLTNLMGTKSHKEQNQILSGYLAMQYMRKKKDSAAWLSKMMPLTLRLLNDISVIGEIVNTEYGRVVHWDSSIRCIRMNAVWYEEARHDYKKRFGKFPNAMSDIPEHERAEYKKKVAQRCVSGFFNGRYVVTTLNSMLAYSKDDQAVGLVPKDNPEKMQPGDTVRIISCIENDGNIIAIEKR
jgi:hypothetical protein